LAIDREDGAVPRPTNDASAEDLPAGRPFAVGDRVRLNGPRPYLKTADPMPMLRPADLVDGAETGQVVEIRAMDRLAVRFRRGTFLLDARDLMAPPPDG
jgi:hypothetical protein